MAKDDNPFFDLAGSEIRSIPQSELEKFIGSFGKRAESLGKSMAEPLTETKKVAPIKSFLAQMLITDPLQSAGTALQDWSHTPRENTSERPYTPSPFYGGSPATLNPNTWGPALQTFRTDPRAVDVASLAQPAGALARAATTKVAKPLARAAGEAMTQRMLSGESLIPGLPQSVAPNPLTFAVKPEKGGNWISRGVDRHLQGLKTKNPEIDISKPPTDDESHFVYRNFPEVDLNFNRALEESDDMRFGDTYWKWFETNYPAEFQSLMSKDVPSVHLNNWIDKKLGKYIRNDMATPHDPVLKLADEKGVLHVPFDEEPAYVDTRRRRHEAGLPVEGFAKTPLGQQWENLADQSINSKSAKTVIKQAELARPTQTAARDLEDNPWLRNVPPETRIYDTRPGEMSLTGFDHLVDELAASLAQNSELPANLRLTVKELDKMTVPHAVEHVAKVNEWRALEAERAEQAGMMENLNAASRLDDPTAQLSFVEKPGMKWIDLPEVVDEKGTKLCTSIGRQGGWCTMNTSTARQYGSGDNRLVAMLDAEGRPHAQAMISTSNYDYSQMHLGDVLHGEEAVGDQYYRNLQTLLERRGINPEDAQRYVELEAFGSPREIPAEIQGLMNELSSEAESMIPKKQTPLSDIIELKPPGNSFSSDRSEVYKKRDPEYQKKISESVVKFLNSGEWGRVNDLNLYNIFDLRDPSSYGGLTKLFGEEGADKVFAATRANGGTPPVRFMTRDQAKDFIERPEIVYHAGAEFNEPRPGLFTHPEREVVEKFQSSTNAPQLHTFEARPRRAGTEEDVYRVARQLGIYDPEIPVGQYLEQGENAIFPQSAQVVEELRNLGFDSLRLQDAMSKKPSLVALDPSVLRRVPPAEGYAKGGAVHMQVGGLASLARRLFKAPVAELGRAGIMSKSGKILTETFTPEELELIQNSIVMSRRKTLDDLAGADKRLKSVHETNRTGAASGPLRSKQARAEREPQMFGGLGQAYGYLTLDPLATLSGELSPRFPTKGTSHIVPTSQIPEYGRFGLVLHPELRGRTTFTIDDSLDRTLGSKTYPKEILRSMPYENSVEPGSVLHDLVTDYDALSTSIVENLKAQGTPQWKIPERLAEELAKINKPATFADLLRSEGLPPMDDGSGYFRLPRQIPRMLDNPTEPSLLSSEIYQLGSDDPTHFRNKLLQRDPMGYVEAQVHGDVTPENIQRIYDFGYEPSLKAEKQAKKLGIDYIPRPPAAYDIIKRANPQTMGEFYRLAEELGVLPSYLKGRESDSPMLPFGGNYAKGGKVSTNPFDHLI
jgi:hypothetical protein